MPTLDSDGFELLASLLSVPSARRCLASPTSLAIGKPFQFTAGKYMSTNIRRAPPEEALSTEEHGKTVSFKELETLLQCEIPQKEARDMGP